MEHNHPPPLSNLVHFPLGHPKSDHNNVSISQWHLQLQRHLPPLSMFDFIHSRRLLQIKELAAQAYISYAVIYSGSDNFRASRSYTLQFHSNFIGWDSILFLIYLSQIENIMTQITLKKQHHKLTQWGHWATEPGSFLDRLRNIGEGNYFIHLFICRIFTLPFSYTEGDSRQLIICKETPNQYNSVKINT